MIKLRDLLMEIGDGSSQPFDYYKSSGSGIKDAKNSIWGTRKGLKHLEGIMFNYIISAEANGEPLTVGLQGVVVTPGRASEAEPETYSKYKKAVSKLGINLDDPEVADVYTDLYIEFDAFMEPNDRLPGEDSVSVLVNDKSYMYRLMATLKEILLTEVRQNNAHVISYTPVKRGKEEDETVKDLGRTKLYSVFINNAFPGSKRIVDEDLVLHQIRPLK